MKRGILLSSLVLAFSTSVFANQWVSRYKGPSDSYDSAYDLAVDSSGNVYVTGVSDMNYLTVKYDSNGNEVWASIYNGPSDGYDAAKAIAVDSSGYVYVTGNSHDDVNMNDYFTIKYDPTNGSEIWTDRLDSDSAQQPDNAYAIAVSTDGSVYVTGQSGGTDVNYSTDYYTFKYNSSGVLQWAKRYNYCSDWDAAYAIAVDATGNAYVTGESYSGTNAMDYTTIKYNSSGVQQWVRRYPTTIDNQVYDGARAIAVDDGSNVYVTGASDQNYLTIKYNSSGTIQFGWPKSYDGNNLFDGAKAIAADSIGNVYVTGQSDNGGTNGIDYATVKYSSGGTQLWAAIYNGPASGADYAGAIAVDASGNVYVTGQSWGGETIKDDYATVKYNSSGVQQWVARYNGPGHGSDYAASLVVDGSDNVYVTGTSFGYETNSDYATIKNPNEVGYCTGPLAGDMNHDCVVDFADFGEFASHWLESNFE